MRSSLAIVLLTLLGVLTTAVSAQITPSQDAYTNSALATTNYGANPLLYVNGATEISYIQFNLGSIPSGASVSQATLKLYVNGVTTAGSFNVDYINGAWVESTITHNLAPALGSAIVASVPLSAASKNQYVLINITPAVVAWLDGSQANDGIALVANSSFNASFDSKENTGTSHPAELDIVFAGGSGTITGVTTAVGSGLTGGGTTGTLNLSLTKKCTNGQTLSWNGSTWVCTTAQGTGTVTNVSAGTGLTGGPITTTGTLSIDATKVPLIAQSNTFTTEQIINSTGISPGLSVTSGGGTYSVGGGIGVTGVTTTSGVGTAGVKGMDQSSTGNSTGVYGFSSSGQGVYGGSTSGYGLVGGGGAAGVQGVSSVGTGVQGQSTSGYGVSGTSTNGVGMVATNTGTGQAVFAQATGSAGQGVWGETFGTSFFDGVGSDGVHGVAHSAAGSGVAGVNDAKDATGVYGSDTQGYGFVTDSQVSQGRGMGGWVKAMAYVNASGAIIRCFNSQLAGSAASTAPCGITDLHNFPGIYALDFGFQVDDRFVSVTPIGATFQVLNACFDDICGASPNQVDVYAGSGTGGSDEPFMIIIF